MTEPLTFEEALASLRVEWRRASLEERVAIEADARAVQLLMAMLTPSA